MKVAGVDVGGTYTDLIMLDQETGRFIVSKVFTTPADQSLGFIEALDADGVSLSDVGLIVHGTTVATNALLERKGAKCGLITTRGFRDVLELRRRDRPTMYGLRAQFRPLVTRELRLEATERTSARGEVIEPIDREEVRRLAQTLIDSGVEVVAVSFLHSYANPENELKCAQALKEVWPNPYVVISSDVLAEFREFERTSTTVINAYLMPVVNGYLNSLQGKLSSKGYRGDVLIIQSNGGVMATRIALERPVNTMLSGPAAGVIAASFIARNAGFSDIISCDMGGTSLDLALIVNGNPQTRVEFAPGFGMPVRLPHLDINTIGAGGGSIARIDKAGILEVGPESAGAEPGPVSYGKGGLRPTVTDANLVLGRINPAYCIGAAEGFLLDVDAARASIAKEIADPLKIGIEQAARAILEVSVKKIAGGIRKISIERGVDPRGFVLIAFGGAGPLHASAVLKEIGISKALIPPFPGITSALGCVVADVRHDYVQTINKNLEELDDGMVAAIFQNHAKKGESTLREEGISVSGQVILMEADMCYRGQTHLLKVPLKEGRLDRDGLRASFEEAYSSKFGMCLPDYIVQVVNLRTAVIGLRPEIPADFLIKTVGMAPGDPFKGIRPVFFGDQFIECPIFERHRLEMGAVIEGPAIVEQGDTTTVIDPTTRATVDYLGNLILETVR